MDVETLVLDGLLGLSERDHLAGATGVVVTPAGQSVACTGTADLSTGEPITPQTRFRLASVTKPLTATMILRAAAQGLLDVDAPVTEYVHDIHFVGLGSRCRAPTVCQLLSHTSGMGDLREPRVVVHALVRRHQQRPHEFHTAQDEFPAGSVLLDVAPGHKFSYSNQNFTLLGRLVAEAYHSTLEEAAGQALFGPADMKTAVLSRPESNFAIPYTGHDRMKPIVPRPSPPWFGGRGAGSIWASGTDMMHFLRALLSQDLLPGELRRLAWTPHWQTHPAMPGWGLGFAIDRWQGTQVVYHNGWAPGAKALLLILPGPGIGVALLANTTTAIERMDSPKTAAAWHIACTAAGIALKRTNSIRTRHLEKNLTGIYYWPRGWNTNLRQILSHGPFLRLMNSLEGTRISGRRGEFRKGALLQTTDDPHVHTIHGAYHDQHLVTADHALYVDQWKLSRRTIGRK